MKNLFSFGKAVATAAGRDHMTQMAAAIAFYAAFSLAPLLVMLVALAGLFMGQASAEAEILARLGDFMGADGARAVNNLLKNAAKPEYSGLASLLSLGVLLFGASRLFAQLQKAFNNIWHGDENAADASWKTKWKAMVTKRLLSFMMVAICGGFLILAMLVSTALSALPELLKGDHLPGWAVFLRAVNLVVSLTLSTVIFAVLYRVLPDTKVEWGAAWRGGLVAALLFAIGKYALGLYLGRGSWQSAYGAAGSFAAMLMWLYYSAQLLLIGAEVSKVWQRRDILIDNPPLPEKNTSPDQT